MAREHFASPGARIGQKKVAYEIVKDIYGEDGAKEAIAMTEALFQGNVSTLREDQIETLFGDSKVKLEPGMMLEDILIALGAATSKREARTFATGNSVLVNGTKVTDPKATFEAKDALHDKYLVVRRGKKNYYLGEF